MTAVIVASLLINLILIGVSLTTLFRLKFFLEEKCAVGLLISLIFLGYINLGFAYLFGLNWGSFLISLLILEVLLLALFLKSTRRVLQEDLQDFVARYRQRSWQLFAGLNCLFLLLYSGLAWRLLTYAKDGLYIALLHAYGDMFLHLGIINSFAEGHNFPVENPNLAKALISYPFLVDFITAQFVNPLGLRVDLAVGVTGSIFMICLILILTFFLYRLTKSKLASILGLSLFFFNGGFGFVHFFRDYYSSGEHFWQFIQHIPHDYTALKDIGFWWINVVISMLLPQRSFLLGLPFALVIIGVFLELKSKFLLPKFIFGSLLISLLPLVHTHTLMILAPFILFIGLMLLVKSPKKIVLLAPIGLIGSLLIVFLSKSFLAQTDNMFSLIKFQPWWMAHGENPIFFYLKNFNILPILTVIFCLWNIKRRDNVYLLALVGLFWFFVGSLFIFQPWDFDNIKIFIYWYIFTLPLVVASLVKMLRVPRDSIKILAGGILILCTITGFIDNWRLITQPVFNTPGISYQLYSLDALKTGNFIKTLPNDGTFLSKDVFNNPAVSIAGRNVVVGFNGWLWSYGLDYQRQQADLIKMLAGQETDPLFREYNIRYILLSKYDTDGSINRNYIRQTFPLIFESKEYEIYQTNI